MCKYSCNLTSEELPPIWSCVLGTVLSCSHMCHLILVTYTNHLLLGYIGSPNLPA